MATLATLSNLTARKARFVMAGAILLVLLVHIAVVGLSPTVWFDEVEIVELGRIGAFEHTTDWSMDLVDGKVPGPGLFHVGGAMQEAAYRLTGGDFRGPRMSTRISLVLAAWVCFEWLLARRNKAWMALTGALLLLLSPDLTRSASGARVDCWAIAALLAACWLLNRIFPEERRAARQFRDLGVGMLAALALLIWPAAAFLFPLLAAEAIRLSIEERWNGGEWARRVGLAGVGVCTVLAAAWLPLHSEWQQAAGGFAASVKQVNTVAAAGTTVGAIWTYLGNLRLIGVFLLWQPFLLPLILLGAMTRRTVYMAAAFVVCVGLMCLTWVYVHRVNWLVPYVVVLAAGTMESPALRRRWVAAGVTVLLALGLVWEAGFSVVARPALAMLTRQERDHGALVRACRNAIGSGNIRVYTDTFQVYYAGRTLGWRLYHNPHAIGTPDWILSTDGQTFLRRMDCYLADAGTVSDPMTNALLRAGFTPRAEVHAENGPVSRIGRTLRSYGATGYGPYTFWRREDGGTR